jgi:hypothetical protein
MSNYPPQYPPQPGQPQFAPPPPAPTKSNKKLFIFLGLGCLGLVVVGVVALVAIVGGGIYALANSEAAITATKFVVDSPAAKAELGEPLSASFAGGNVGTNNGVGNATINVSVTGPKGSGTATVVMTSSGSEKWQVTSGELTGGPSGSTVRLK